MTTNDLKHTLEECEAGWSTHDIERVILLCTDDCTYEDVPLAAVNHGKHELRVFGQQVFDAFPDLKLELTSHVATSDSAMLKWAMSGTHQGDLQGILGNRQIILGARSDRPAAHGRTDQPQSDYWDMAALLTQLGLNAV